jgi:hypothetical protein
MATTLPLPSPPTRTQNHFAPMIKDADDAESLQENRLRHMSKDDQALAKMGYKSECKSFFSNSIVDRRQAG